MTRFERIWDGVNGLDNEEVWEGGLEFNLYC